MVAFKTIQRLDKAIVISGLPELQTASRKSFGAEKVPGGSNAVFDQPVQGDI